MYKKTISPIVGISLLLVVSTVAVMGFQNWYSGFQSELNVDVEQRSTNTAEGINIEFISSDGQAYITNSYSENISLDEIKVGDVDCSINYNLSPGVNIISIKSCLEEQKISEIRIVTNEGLYTKKIFTGDFVSSFASCTLDSITVNHNENYTFYNSSLVPFGYICSSFSLVRVCNDGYYSGDSSYNYSSCSVIGQDINPDPFNFTNRTGVALNTLISSDILVPSGYDGPLSVGVTGDGSPQLSVNGGGWTTSTTMNPTESLQIRLTSSNQVSNTSLANLTLGNYSTIWNVTTQVASDCSDIALISGAGSILNNFQNGNDVYSDRTYKTVSSSAKFLGKYFYRGPAHEASATIRYDGVGTIEVYVSRDGRDVTNDLTAQGLVLTLDTLDTTIPEAGSNPRQVFTKSIGNGESITFAEVSTYGTDFAVFICTN